MPWDAEDGKTIMCMLHIGIGQPTSNLDQVSTVSKQVLEFRDSLACGHS